MKTLQKSLLLSLKKNNNRNAIWVNNKYYTYNKIKNLSEKYRKIYSQSNSNSVCILSEKNIDCYAAIMATMLDGRIYVPLNPRFPVEKNRQIFNQSEAKILFVENKFAHQIKHIIGTKYKKKKFIIITDKNKSLTNCKLKSSKLKFFKKAMPSSICYILFTSGTTGAPKGVPISNSNLTSYLNHIYKTYKINRNDKFSHNFDLTFDLSIHDIFLCWMSGACLYVTPKNQLLNPGYFIKKKRLTIWFSVPSLGLNMEKMKQLKKNSFPSIRQTFFCGEALPHSLAEKWNDAAPNSKIDNLYGPTETTIAILGYSWKKNISKNESINGIVPIGVPFKKQLANHISQKNSQQIGELCLSGSQVFKGYLKNKKESRLKLFKSKDKKLWYKTGDIIKKNSNGSYIFLNRADKQIKISGFRVETQEVEYLIKKIIKSSYSAVIGWPLINKNNNLYSGLIAFILNEIKMKNYIIIRKLNEQLPYYSVPKKIIRLKKFPLNINGKIDYKELASGIKI